MADDRKKLDGQRRAVREHIEKRENYSYPQDKNFADKTISRAQNEIEDLKKRNSSFSSSWEDKWKPKS